MFHEHNKATSGIQYRLDTAWKFDPFCLMNSRLSQIYNDCNNCYDTTSIDTAWWCDW